MLDAPLRLVLDPALNLAGRRLATLGLRADQVTIAGLLVGLLAALLIALGQPGAALLPLIVSRVADGLDGAVARATASTDFGGYLDIVADFLFYGAIPAAFALSDPATNGAAAAVLLLSFYVNGASFLGYAILAERRGQSTDARGIKSLYFSAGLLEGTETIVFLSALCIWPAAFAPLSWIFAALCFVTALMRIFAACHQFQSAAEKA